MVISRLTPLRVATFAGLAFAVLGTQAHASAMNEYTLSPPTTTPTITTYQAQPTLNTQPSYNNTVTIQTSPAQPAAPQFGELIYDAQPYLPDSPSMQTGTTITQPYNGTIQTAPAMIQPLAPIVTN